MRWTEIQGQRARYVFWPIPISVPRWFEDDYSRQAVRLWGLLRSYGIIRVQILADDKEL